MALTDEEKEEIADLIVAKLGKKEPISDCHAFTSEERQAIRDVVKAKKKAVNTVLWLIGVLVLWVLKDIYYFVASHISFNWPTR